MDGQKQKKSHMEHLFFFFYLNIKIKVARACSSISHTQWNKLWLSVPFKLYPSVLSAAGVLRPQQSIVTSPWGLAAAKPCRCLMKMCKETGSLWRPLMSTAQPSQQHETMPPPHPSQSTQLMGNWSRLERSPVQRYQGWEGGVNSGRDASAVKPLIMTTNWSWLLERQAAAVGRPAFEVPPACCRVPGPLAWGDAGTMWLPVGKNVMRRQGDGAQDGWRVDGSAGAAGGPVGRTSGTTGDSAAGWGEREQGCVHVLLCSLVTRTITHTHTHTGWRGSIK